MEEAQTDVKREYKDNIITSQHTVNIQGKEYSYTATVGTIVLKKEESEKSPQSKGEFFFMAYTLNDVEDYGKRPITISFNGGPGSSSVWLHLGVLGPRRVVSETTTEEGVQLISPPYSLINNDYSILDKTDLCFIDPISTGFSRPVEGEKENQFHGYDEDIQWVAEFIRMYITRYNRWLSPKFLIGESYGTTRAGGLSGYLQERLGIYLNGIMLVSSILDFQTTNFNVSNDMPYICFFPSFVATAWYHKMISSDLQNDLQSTLRKAESFALNEYSVALLKGDRLTDEDKNKIAVTINEFTGLPVELILQNHLRIPAHTFFREFLRSDGKSIGRLDSRYTLLQRNQEGFAFFSDPSYIAIQGPYTATFNDYVRRELKYETDLPYEILISLSSKWNYSKFQNNYVNSAETLADAMTKNPYLKVIICNGYYDLATPYFGTEFSINHMKLDRNIMQNITMKYYEAGHMMYIHQESLEKQRKDLVDFLDNC
ncbi:MAG: peptidase S10 [Candidatus Heimdallarchaeota archaeon]|nr:peptidase S10 [Candidatus Heimdallarchaeota archaeon]